MNQNSEDYTRGEFTDEELEEWFEVETVCREDMHKCNFCDLRLNEYNIMKEHLISEHREAIVTLSSNSNKNLE